MGSEPAEMMSHIPEEDKLRTEGPESVSAGLAVEHTMAWPAEKHAIAWPAKKHEIAAPRRSYLLWIVSTACVQAG